MPTRAPTYPPDDPLAMVMLPPPDESEEQKNVRLEREEEARRISQEIDDAIKQERHVQRKKKVVKLLLLGQSESGKSTTLRQFQRLYTPSAFREERILWRAVIQLNLIRSIRTILDTVTSYQQAFSMNRQQRYSHYDHDGASQVASGSRLGDDYSDTDDPSLLSHTTHYSYFAEELEQLKMRLLPLRHIEALLIAKLVPPSEDEATNYGFTTSYLGATNGHDGPAKKHQEIFVRPGTAWKCFLRGGGGTNGKGRPLSVGTTGIETQDEATTTIYQCRHDLISLWNDPSMREILRIKKVRLEEQPGFFLDDLERITSLKYLPSEDDVLRARLKTVGVSEYKFEMESGRESGAEWRIIDVGGSRSQRQTWIPFFDDVDAIIFLAPISGFDQVLAEDRTVNRLEDSVLLWKMICSNKLLAKVDLVLFLNKCDILDRKLKAGVSLAKYVRSFQDRPNDCDVAQKYFRAKFSAIQREYSPSPRKFYGFCTSVTEVVTTSGILASVRDMVIREHLKKSRLL